MSLAKALPILMYHHVSPAPGLVTVSPEIFRDHIATLARAGWRSAGASEIEGFFTGKPVPPRTCVITFDDGYLDNFIYAHPVLAEFGMMAVLFIVTGWIGDGVVRSRMVAADHNRCKALIGVGESDAVMLRWSEIEAMKSAGTFEFHSHTHSHTRWDREIVDPANRAERLSDDLKESRRVLQVRLGQVSRHLCWPQGYYDEAYVGVAVATGFDHLYTTHSRINTPARDTHHIGRFVTKARPGSWVLSRTGIYSRPLLGRLYSRLH